MNKGVSIANITKNKNELLEKTKGQTVSFTAFIAETKNSKFKFLMRRVISDIEMAKVDFDLKRENITFEIHGSKELQFGKKITRKDIYVLENKEKLTESILDYFNEEAKLKTKDKALIDEFLEVLNENILRLSQEKSISFTFRTAKISIKLEPVSQFVEINGSKGAKIDLSL